MADIIYRMNIFLHLAELELCGESYIQEADASKDETDSSADIEQLKKELKWMEEVMQGGHRMIVLRKISKPYALPEYVHLPPDSEDGENHNTEESRETNSQGDEAQMFQIPLEQFFEAIRQYTEFIDDPYHLEFIPIDTVDIGDHTYQLPKPFISSLTYQQYQNAQRALGDFWIYAQNIEHTMQEISSLPKDRQEDEEFMQSYMTRITGWNKEMKLSQQDFLSHVLTLGHTTIENREVLKPDAAKRVEEARKKGEECELTKKDFILKKFSKTEYNYNAFEIEQLAVVQEMKKAPSWLFPVLHQNFQSSMIAHKKNFPYLFSGSGGGGGDPFVGMLNTVNAVMKWQTYQSQQAVYDDNAVSVFAVLNNMTKEAKDMEEANKKMKRKSKR